LPVPLYQEFPTFDRAVDTFFSELEAQKIQQRAMQQERAALKKLEKARSTHQQRVEVGITRGHV
jgi:predicted ribosome quality control (RQC) complex YloA/Tae2 family protein